jgi:hypothetical protein
METVPTFSVNNDNCQRQFASRHPMADLDVAKDWPRRGKLRFRASSVPILHSTLDEQRWLDSHADRRPGRVPENIIERLALL